MELWVFVYLGQGIRIAHVGFMVYGNINMNVCFYLGIYDMLRSVTDEETKSL